MGESASVAGAVPVPVSDAVWVPALSVIVKMPVRVPEAVGVKVMETVQAVLGGEGGAAGVGGDVEVAGDGGGLQGERCRAGVRDGDVLRSGGGVDDSGGEGEGERREDDGARRGCRCR